jgi:hypothetical protein
VVLGGVACTVAEAVSAAAVLSASRTSAIFPVLTRARSPLAACDYRAAAAPYLEWARYAPRTGRSGAAGRHVTKIAFLDAIAGEIEAARRRDIAAALRSLGSDERYAAAIAASASERPPRRLRRAA